jgi:tetratricopeptide (TPR) repeat protein
MSQRKKRTEQKMSAQPADVVSPMPRAGVPGGAAWMLAALVLLTGAICSIYGQAVNAPFIFDDLPSVEENLSIRGLWPLVGDSERPGPLRPPHHNPIAGRPVVNLSLAVNYYFGQLDPTGYHVVNICLHVLCGLLLFAIVRHTLLLAYFGGRFDRAAGPLALVVALLWALHPLQTETVVYVTQRTELMVAFFYLATLYGSLRYWAATTQGGRAAWLALAILASLAGMASKEVMVSAPVIVLLCERTFVAGSFRRAWRQSWPLYVGLAATWGLLLALNVSGPRSDTAGFSLGVPVFAWWFTQAKILGMYSKLVVWPWPLAIHYGMPYLTLAAAWPWLLGVTLLATSVVILLWRNHPAGFLGAWMAAILAPTFVVPITTEVAAERRMYLPLAALLALVVVGGYWLVQQTSLRLGGERNQASTRRWLLAAAGCATLLLVLAASVTSAHRLAMYNNPLTLWQDTVASQPDDPMAHYNLGIVLAKQDRLQEAIQCYQRTIELKPDYANAHYNMANLLARAGQLKEAIDQYRWTLRIHPNDADAHFNLGLILAEAGQPTQAVDEFQVALQLEPDFADVHAELGYVLTDLGRVSEAITHMEQATKLKPADSHIAYCYGSALLKAGRVKEAIERFRYALELKPDYADAHNNLTIALASIDRVDEAIQHGQRAVQLEPDRADAHANLGALLLRQGQTQQAIAEFRTALQLDPNLWDTQVSLAGALRETGQLQEAIEQYQQAMRLDPDNLSIYGNLAEAYIQTNQSDKAIALTQEAVRIARSKGQTELADKIEAWLTGYQAGLTDSPDVPSTTDETP